MCSQKNKIKTEYWLYYCCNIL